MLISAALWRHIRRTISGPMQHADSNHPWSLSWLYHYSSSVLISCSAINAELKSPSDFPASDTPGVCPAEALL